VRRLLWLVLLLGIACGKESSIVPIVSLAPGATPTATVPATIAPTEAPTPSPTASATPSLTPTVQPTATPTVVPPTPTPVPTHTPTPKSSPPQAYLRAASGEIRGDVTHFNWTDGSQRRTFEDPSPDPATSISVTRGEILKIFFTRSDAPSDAGARYRTDPAANAKTTAVPIDKKNPATVTANFPTGTVWLDVFTYWPEGDVEHTFKLIVR
jgi:hypothetical protein